MVAFSTEAFFSSDLGQWCRGILGAIDSVTPLAFEASVRRYYRLVYGEQTAILMDASEERDMAAAHVRLSEPLLEAGIRVPRLVASDLDRAYVLLEDFGDESLCDRAHRQSIDKELMCAVDTLIHWQSWGRSSELCEQLPFFSSDSYERKLGLFKNHYLLDRTTAAVEAALQGILERLVNEADQQPQVFLHRDYHSRNLMCLEDGLGVIDFQDAMMGPQAYDLVSLLRDCYWESSSEQLDSMTRYYHASNVAPSMSYDAFMTGFDWLGIGRHLKCLGLFSRLANEANKLQYLSYIPRTAGYVLQMAERYHELEPLKGVLEDALCKQ